MAAAGPAEKWRTILSPEQFRILRQKGTQMQNSTIQVDNQIQLRMQLACLYEGFPRAIKCTLDRDRRRT